MVKLFPYMVIDGWEYSISLHGFEHGTYKARYRADIAVRNGEEGMCFCLDIFTTADEQSATVVGHLIVLLTNRLIPLLEINAKLWKSDIDLPLIKVEVINVDRQYALKLLPATCGCTPCRIVDQLVRRNRKHLEELRYGDGIHDQASADDEATGRSSG